MGILTTAKNANQEKESFSPASKFIELVEYDAQGKTLDITFKSGTKIRHLVVYPSTFLSFKESPTIDAYYSRGLKGRFQTVKIVDAGIGRKQSAPLKKVTKEQSLDTGLREQRFRNDRITGTVNRAFDVAVD